MDEIRVPQHVVDRFERRWTSRLARCWKAGKVWSAPWLFITLGWNIYGPALQPIEDAGFENSHRRD